MTGSGKCGYINIALLEVATKKVTWVTDLKWEAYSGNFSLGGKRYAYNVNDSN
ncbi:MAG: hypothetical protein WCA20_15795 [Candidatus Sulfotelmatobacter sp.]